ncbi:MAG TPA: peptidylprolyl isomerase [Steroidobacteraceae bacterium]|jgi:peptidylprolyl isomerase|nr:peptidylprolyl isomerase [Steroidobacteraceae bacterium]
MRGRRFVTVALSGALMGLVCSGTRSAVAEGSKPLTVSEVIAASNASDWRPLDPQRTLYMDLDAGRVIIELAPDFAPRHVANIIALVRERYFDGLAFMRAQDNYVVQWGDADGKREVHAAKKTLAAEFARPATNLAFTRLQDPDTYAPEVGFSNGFAAARDPATNTAWLTHCYGAVGVGRDNDADSGGGTELYVVIGHSPRHLDRNVTLVGRVVKGMEILSTLRRGTGALGFYEKAEERTPIRTIRLAADVPASERTPLEVLRTDTPTFAALIEARRNRSDEWFKYKAGHVDVCNVPVMVRTPPP